MSVAKVSSDGKWGCERILSGYKCQIFTTRICDTPDPE
jgi:hypothetical protein